MKTNLPKGTGAVKDPPSEEAAGWFQVYAQTYIYFIQHLSGVPSKAETSAAAAADNAVAHFRKRNFQKREDDND